MPKLSPKIFRAIGQCLVLSQCSGKFTYVYKGKNKKKIDFFGNFGEQKLNYKNNILAWNGIFLAGAVNKNLIFLSFIQRRIGLSKMYSYFLC